jgi:hypothetical protein
MKGPHGSCYRFSQQMKVITVLIISQAIINNNIDY